MRKLVMSLSVLGGLLFAGTLPASANAAAGLTAVHIDKANSNVTKTGWRGGGGAIAAGAIAAGVVADGVDGVTVAGDAVGEAAAFILAYRSMAGGYGYPLLL